MSDPHDSNSSSCRECNPVRVLLADDHVAIRAAISKTLELEPDIQIIGEAADGQQAVALSEQFQPDVVLMDCRMSVLDGIEATRLILAHSPQIRIIALSMYDKDQLQAMIAAGAETSVDKLAGIEPIITAIRGSGRSSSAPLENFGGDGRQNHGSGENKGHQVSSQKSRPSEI